jgi:hypothetical protein
MMKLSQPDRKILLEALSDASPFASVPARQALVLG